MPQRPVPRQVYIDIHELPQDPARVAQACAATNWLQARYHHILSWNITWPRVNTTGCARFGCGGSRANALALSHTASMPKFHKCARDGDVEQPSIRLSYNRTSKSTASPRETQKTQLIKQSRLGGIDSLPTLPNNTIDVGYPPPAIFRPAHAALDQIPEKMNTATEASRYSTEDLETASIRSAAPSYGKPEPRQKSKKSRAGSGGLY